jgi:hypothetical protein
VDAKRNNNESYSSLLDTCQKIDDDEQDFKQETKMEMKSSILMETEIKS